MRLPTQADLDGVRARLTELTHRGISALIVADDRGVISYVDAALARKLGWRPEELVGTPLTTIIPIRFRDAHHLGFSRFLMTHEPTLLGRPVTLVVLSRRGEELPAEHVIIARRGEYGWLFAADIRVEEHGD